MNMNDNERIQVVRHEPIVVVELLCTHLLDEMVIHRVQDDLMAVIRGETPPLLVLSFASVRYLSSMTLRMLLNLRQEVLQAKGQMRLAAIGPEIREVFSTTRLDSLFQIHASTEEAVLKMQHWLRLIKGSSAPMPTS